MVADVGIVRSVGYTEETDRLIRLCPWSQHSRFYQIRGLTVLSFENKSPKEIARDLACPDWMGAQAAFQALAGGGTVRCLNAKGLAEWSRKQVDALEASARKLGLKGLARAKVTGAGCETGIAKFLSAEFQSALAERVDAAEGDLLLFVAACNTPMPPLPTKPPTDATLRVAILLSVAGALVDRLKKAYAQVPIGNPLDEGTLMGPLIRPPGEDLERGLKELEPGEKWAVMPKKLDGNPGLYTPGIKWNVQPGSFTHMTELFGPVLGVMKARDLDEALLHEAVDRAALDLAPTGDHAIAEVLLLLDTKAYGTVGHKHVQFPETPLVEKDVQPLPGRQLVFLMLLGNGFFATHSKNFCFSCFKIF